MTVLHCMMRLIEAQGKASIRMMWQFHSPNQKTESKPAQPSLAIQKSLWLPVNQQSRYLEVFFSKPECLTDFGTFEGSLTYLLGFYIAKSQFSNYHSSFERCSRKIPNRSVIPAQNHVFSIKLSYNFQVHESFTIMVTLMAPCTM